MIDYEKDEVCSQCKTWAYTSARAGGSMANNLEKLVWGVLDPLEHMMVELIAAMRSTVVGKQQ